MEAIFKLTDEDLQMIINEGKIEINNKKDTLPCILT
jgi:hypothetical protein